MIYNVQLAAEMVLQIHFNIIVFSVYKLRIGRALLEIKPESLLTENHFPHIVKFYGLFVYVGDDV